MTAAAAAISGLIRCVRPPRPWRPSKLRLEVEAQRSPGARMSGFMPRHIEQPAPRHSKPAVCEHRAQTLSLGLSLNLDGPGNDHRRTPAATRRPSTMRAAARKSSMRPFVHEPRKTQSIGT